METYHFQFKKGKPSPFFPLSNIFLLFVESAQAQYQIPNTQYPIYTKSNP